MQVWEDVSAIGPSIGPTVVTIGNFDGVHLGHRHVIRRAHEVAAELGISEGTVKSRLFRARERLAGLLDDKEERHV